MTTGGLFGVLVLSMLGGLAGTRVALTYARAYGVTDTPSARSSHVVPTPRGGGIAIVAVTLGTALAMSWDGIDPSALALIGGGLIVAAVGLWDDHGHVAFPIRLAAHGLAVATFLGAVGEGVPLSVPDEVVSLVGVLVALAMVWSVNLYNFMDGIDGLAATEAVTAAGGLGLFFALSGDGYLAAATLGLAGAATGFLWWNWAPARIFMGDVGSGFIGFWLAAITVYGASRGSVSPWSSLALLGVFLVDASLTLLVRLLRRERWYIAHRSHAYQRAAQRWGHRRVVLAVTAINLFWLLPLGVAANEWRAHGGWFAAVAIVPLVVLAWRLGAGRPG